MSSEHAADHGSDHGHGHGPHHGTDFYIKTYAALMALFLISVLGPLLEIKIVTLITAFGIAGVKAYLVMRNFMHLNVEKPFVWYMLTTAVAFMALFFAGVAPDVLSHDGNNWENVAAKAEVARGMAAGDGHGDGHGAEGDHGDAHGAEGDHGDGHGGDEHDAGGEEHGAGSEKHDGDH